jgi:hypothetical protein
LAESKTRFVTFAIGSVILAALIGIGHVLWTRSAESDIVHYSWPVKWALTFAAESPDLPPGSRFKTAQVVDGREGERWRIAGQVELPSRDGQRITTNFTADILSRCAVSSERRCWAMDSLTFGSVPAATRPAVESRLLEHTSVLELAAVSSEIETPTSSEPGSVTGELSSEAEEDLAFILAEPVIEPTDALAAALGGWSTIRGRHPPPPKPYDPVMVRDIQRGLAALGYDPGPVDGMPGRRTRAAAESFGQREGLASAAIDSNLLDEINRRLSTEVTAPLEIFPPAAYDDQRRDADRDVRNCTGINSKIRDCDS